MICDNGMFKLETTVDYGVVRTTNVKKKRNKAEEKKKKQQENRKQEDKALFKELAERKKANFIRSLEEGSKKRKRTSGEIGQYDEKRNNEKKYCMDAKPTTTTGVTNLSVQGGSSLYEKKVQRTVNVQQDGKLFKMGQFKKIKNLFKKNCSKDDFEILLQPKTEQLEANLTNGIRAEKEENLQTAQQGAGTREHAIGGELGQVQPSANENARK